MARIFAVPALRFSGSLCRRPVTTLLLCTLIVLVTPAAGCEKDTPFTPPPPACTYSVSATSVSFDVPGGSQQITVSTASHCTWTARTDAAWLSVTGGATGTGPGTVTVAAAANAGTSERESVLVVADQSVVVRQACLSACTYDISPTHASIRSDGDTGSFAVSAAEHCSWTAVSRAGWLEVTSGASGSGNGTVAYRADRNTEPLRREANIDVAGRVFTLTQEGDVEGCQYAVAPVSFSPCMTAGEMTSTVTTAPGCPWTATAGAPWISLSGAASGEGTGTVAFRVTDNWDPPRSGVVEIRWPAATAGQNLHISQAGCYYSVSQSSMAFTAAGGSGSFDVITFADPITCGGPLQDRCLWTASSNVAWITITTSLPRSGDDRLSFTVAANDGPARSGRITVRDKVVEISQAAR